MAFNTSQFQTGAFNGNQFGNFMSGGFTSPTSQKKQEDDTYDPRYPGFNKENYEKLEKKVAALGLTGNKKQEVMDEFYRQILPQVENEKTRSKRNEVINQKSYEVSQIKDESERKIAKNNLSVVELAQMVKEKEGLREDAPDAAVFNARIKSIPNGGELLANYMNNGDDTLLYKGGLKKETGWQKAADFGVGVLQSPGKRGYNMVGQRADKVGKRAGEGLGNMLSDEQKENLREWLDKNTVIKKDMIDEYSQVVAQNEAEGNTFNGREQTDIRTPLLGSDYRANNGWTKGGEVVGDIGTAIAMTAPLGAALSPAIAGGTAGEAALLGAVEGGIDTLATQYGTQGNLDISPMQAVLGVGGGALGGFISNKLANLPKAQQDNIRKEAAQYIEKSIKPTVKGKQSQVAYDKFIDDTLDVTDWMSKNKSILQYTDDAGETVTGKLPTNLRETSDALSNMKKYIYDQYNSIAQSAGDAGAKVNLNKLYDKLDDLANNNAVNLANPGLKNAIESYKNQLLQYSDDLGNITIQEAQDTMQYYNKILDAYFKNPGAMATDTSKNIVVANLKRGLADAVDDSMDDVLNAGINKGSTASQQYKDWKLLYSKIKTIEDEVSKRALVEARKNTKGLSTDIIDALAGGNLVEGVLTQNPTGLLKGAVMKGINAYNKYLNSPDTQIRNLFNLVEKTNNPNLVQTATSSIGNAIRGTAQSSAPTVGTVTPGLAGATANELTND